LVRHRARQHFVKPEIDGPDDGADRLRAHRVGDTLHDPGPEFENRQPRSGCPGDDAGRRGRRTPIRRYKEGLDRRCGIQGGFHQLHALGDKGMLAVAHARAVDEAAEALNPLVTSPEPPDVQAHGAVWSRSESLTLNLTLRLVGCFVDALRFARVRPVVVFESRQGDLHEGGERLRITHGEIGEVLAVHVHLGAV